MKILNTIKIIIITLFKFIEISFNNIILTMNEGNGGILRIEKKTNII